MDSAANVLRTRRFERSHKPRPIQITQRDIALLSHVSAHRFISSEQLAALDGGSEQNVRRCLKALFEHGYLDRPKAQLSTLPITGARPFVYGLTRKGARLLRDHGIEANISADWSENNKRAGNIFIDHTVAIADFLTLMQKSVNGRTDVRFIDKSEILSGAPELTQRAREPMRWVTKAKMDNELTELSVIPDAMFGLEFDDGTAAYFLVEIDRGTMPVVRSRGGLSRTNYQRKMLAYYEGWKQGRHVRQFGLKQLRILTVTTSPQRVVNMVQALKEITDGNGSNLFLFIDRDTLSTGCLDAAWISGRGEPVFLTG